MTTQQTDLGSLNASTPAFTLAAGQSCTCKITAPTLVGIAVLEHLAAGPSAWQFVRQMKDGDQPQLSGGPAGDSFRVRLSDYASGTLTALFATIDPAPPVDSAAILSQANSYADSTATTKANAAQTSAQAYADSKDSQTLASANSYADSVAGSGGSGAFTLGTGGVAAELAPSVAGGTYVLSGAGVTQDAGGIHFSAAANVSFADANVTLKDGISYDVAVTVVGLSTSGGAGKGRILVYGATTAHAGITAEFTADGNYTFQVTTNGAGSLANKIRIQATGPSTPGNTFTVSALSVRETGGTSYPSRPMRTKILETGVSVQDFANCDPTGVGDSTSAFAAAFAYGARKVRVPAGTYNVSSLNVSANVELIGDSPDTTIIQITGTGRVHGLQITGSSALGRKNKIVLRDFTLKYVGAGLQAASGVNDNWSGIYCQRKVYAENVIVDGFTNDGLFYAPSDASEGATSVLGTVGNAVFFSRWVNCQFINNGRDGAIVRMGANAISFVNCQFNNNKQDGLHQATQGGSTYNTSVRDGQASYNSRYGYNLESGTNWTSSGLYAEFNGSPTNTNTDGYTNTPYDFYIGDNAVRTWFGIGTLLNNSTSHVRLPGFNAATIQVWQAGQKLFGN